MFLLSLLIVLHGRSEAQELPPPEPAVLTEALANGSTRIVPARQVPSDAREAEALLLEFGEIDLFDLTLYVADVLRRNFLVSEEQALRGKRVRLIGHEAMTLDEAWEAYLSALRVHGFTTSTHGEVTTIVGSGDASRGPTAIASGTPVQVGEVVVTQLLPLTHARVSDLVQIVRPLVSDNAQVMAYVPTNTLILTDTATNVRKVHELVGELDVGAASSSMALVRLQFADAAELKALIEELYVERGSGAGRQAPASRRPTRSRGARTPQQPATPTSTGEEQALVSRVLHDERTNSLIVLASEEGHRAVESLVAQLDVDVDPTGPTDIHVIDLRYAMAEEVATVLGQLAEDSRRARGPEAERRAQPVDEAAEPDLARALDGGARIAADPATNALAVLAEPADYAAIAALVAQLDSRPGQVFVDAVFVELTSTNGRELGIGAHTLPRDDSPLMASAQLDPTGSLNTFSVSPDLLSGLAAGVFGPAVDVAGPDGSALSVPTFGIALRALQTTSDVHVMGNPALLAVDHQEATLTVGSKVPFPIANQLGAFGNQIQTFERVDVAMELKVTPHINETELDGTGIVTMDVELVVDEVESGTESAAGGPTTSGRSLTSRVMVDDGQTIVIATVGGTKLDVAERKIPILGDIPLIGALFRGTRKQTRNTSLMVFLTPYVVERPSDLTAIRRMKEAQRQEYMRRFQGKQGADWLEALDGLLRGPDPPDEPVAQAAL